MYKNITKEDNIYWVDKKLFPEVIIDDIHYCLEQDSDSQWEFLNIYDKPKENNISQCDENSTSKLLFSIQYINKNNNYSPSSNPDLYSNLYKQYSLILETDEDVKINNNIVTSGIVLSFSKELFKDEIKNIKFSFIDSNNNILETILLEDKIVLSNNNNIILGKIYSKKGIILLDMDKIKNNDIEFNISNGDNPNIKIFEFLLNSIQSSQNKWKIQSQRLSSYMGLFLRIKNNDFNYSLNPTFFNENDGSIKTLSMINNPKTYITTVGLYNDKNELLAIAKMSKPLEKGFVNEYLLNIKIEF